MGEEGFRLDCDTQYRYTPDPGTVKGPVCCGVCGTQMLEERGLEGARSWTQAMCRGKSKYDSFTCPVHKEDWHRQVIALRREARDTSSKLLEQMLLEEADEVLRTRSATKDVSFKGW
jgi:hypothetical protein